MAILQAIFLGIIEGLTEFLPISSTGHLVVAERVIGYKDAAELFTVVIQLGAIAAVIWHYRKELIDKFAGLFSGNKSTQNFWVNWIAATIPAALAGLLVASSLDKYSTPGIVGLALLLGGVAIWLIETYHTPKPAKQEAQLDKLTLKQAIQVGCYQILAVIPGVSRSGATIMGGLLTGLDRLTATAFSFYLSIPILVLASGFKLVKDGDKISQITGGTTALIVGIVVSFFAALAVVNWLLHFVSNHSFKPFAYYRIVFGLLIMAVVIIK